MKYCLLISYVFIYNVVLLFESIKCRELPSIKARKLLSDTKHPSALTHNHTSNKNAKLISSILKEEDASAGTEAAVLFIVAIVVLSVIGMVIYFLRKFDQLNKSLPTYRYSSLKTEINSYESDDKNESQALVAVSTEEEDDFDDEDEISPPTLLVQSQTINGGMSNKTMNGGMSISQESKPIQVNIPTKSGDSSLDSDDELLQ